MPSNDDAGRIHEDVFELLPWWVNRTLDAAEQQRVDAHVADCEACRREIDALTRLNETTTASADAFYRRHADTDRDLATVMQRIADDRTAQRNVTPSSPQPHLAPLSRRLQQGLSVASGWLRSLGTPQWVAATAVAAVLAAILVTQLRHTTDAPRNDYRVLSSDESTGNRADGLRLVVRVSDAAPMADTVRQRLVDALAEWQSSATLAWPADGGLVVTLPEDVDVETLNRIVSVLKSDSAVTDVELVP